MFDHLDEQGFQKRYLKSISINVSQYLEFSQTAPCFRFAIRAYCFDSNHLDDISVPIDVGEQCELEVALMINLSLGYGVNSGKEEITRTQIS